ncbi:hypothetical protein SAMN05216303_102279 [Rhodoferax sp. OV413]|uniref:hypothetical protein n=1 Tax=Rhodoferax sp. OV413 TaxID=1855285 RepID=UPI00088E7281|nr:hypothetical protein [Rhodoferax sp. OV413]SDO75797.1 hypothetical protein SAMN05216303_102279 [Rhodoferax sp. OV413]
MDTRFSKTTRCFYPLSENYGDGLPEDVQVVPEEDYLAALARKPDETLDLVNGRVVILAAIAPTEAELVQQRIGAFKAAISAYLDAAAKAKGYDNIVNAALRAAYPGPYHAEGVAFATWMDLTWQKSYELLAQWEAGSLSEPTTAELLAMLPEAPQ